MKLLNNRAAEHAICEGRKISKLFHAIIAFALTGTAIEAQDFQPECGLYQYRAKNIRVIDGDTIEADIDLGFNVWRHKEHLRLLGVEAPENKTDEGKSVTKILTGKIGNQPVLVCTVKMKRKDREATGSFGRYLATVYLNGENLNDWLIAEGHAFPLDR